MNPVKKAHEIFFEEMRGLNGERERSPSDYSLGDFTLYIFDFDDTLATTDNLVTVTSLDPESGDQNVESMDSHAFEKYRERPDEKRKDDVITYENFDEVLNPVEIQEVLALIRDASQSEDATTVIITARSGERNKKDISDFLESKGITNIPIHTTGDDGGRPVDKLRVVQKYIEDYIPSEIHYYDDSKNNRDAIISLCAGNYPGLKVDVYDVINDSPSLDASCETAEDPLLEIDLRPIERIDEILSRPVANCRFKVANLFKS